jgi:hypothetical protein
MTRRGRAAAFVFFLLALAVAFFGPLLSAGAP